MSSKTSNGDHKSKEFKMYCSDKNLRRSEDDEVKSSESSTDDGEDDEMHISDSDYIPDTSDSDNSSVASSSNDGCVSAEANFQPLSPNSDTEQNKIAKYQKIGVIPELIGANLKNITEPSEIVNHKKVDLSDNISTGRKNISLLSQPNNQSKIELSKNADNNPQNNQLSVQENLSLRKGFVVNQISQNNPQQPLQMNKADDTVFKNCELNSSAFSIEMEKKAKKRMQLKLKEKFMNIITQDNKKIKLSMLRKLKDMARKDFLTCLMYLELIPSYYKCPKCGKNMSLGKGKGTSDIYAWVCQNGQNGIITHHAKRSVRIGTVFYNKVLCLEKILILFHCWVYKMPYEWIFLELDHSKASVTAWLQICRNICTEICAKDDTKVGGDGKVVEISGKVFENNAHKTLEFKWIFFGIEDAGTDKYFFRIFDKCNQQSFLEAVKSAVLPGTTIVSEFCSVYSDSLKDLASLYTFKSLADSSLKNSLWKYFIDQLPRQKKKNFDSHIGEFVWRRKNSHVHDKMKKFLSDMKIAFPLQTEDVD